MQSYAGDAICDGAALEWEYKRPLEGLTEENLREITSEDLVRLELQRMEYNAYKVCEEVGHRIDGATAPGGYLNGYVSEKPILHISTSPVEIHQLSRQEKIACACGNYYKKLEDFSAVHEIKGQKYAEIIKDACLNSSQCDFCRDHPWVGPVC